MNHCQYDERRGTSNSIQSYRHKSIAECTI